MHLYKSTAISISLLLLCALHSGVSFANLTNGEPYTVATHQNGFVVDGEYKLLRGGSVQWFRLPPESWEDRLKRFKSAGFNTVDMYVAWNQIERTNNHFDFDNPNIRYFLELCQSLGLYVYFRPGPYITNELDGGGIPGWLTNISTKKTIKADGKPNFRTDDPDFLFYVERYLGRLNDVITPYLASNGGPIILYALENEYNWFEIFHEADKIASYNGGPERSWLSMLPTRNYFTALKNIVVEDGIDVPLTTCPGDGKTTGTGDVSDIIPMPNVYNGLGGEMPEKVAYDLLKDMHNPNNHNGNYVNFPSGTTETDRDPIRIKRMIMGGFDATFPFNIVGMHQEGYMNSVVLNANGSNVLDTLFDFSSLSNLVTGFISPTVGYFHNVIDYNGAISPSGVHRDNFYSFRRDNLFFDAVENYLAPATHANRSGQLAEPDLRLSIDNPLLGAIEGQNRIHYWMEGSEGTRFINLVNQTGSLQHLAPHSITLEGLTFPRYSTLKVPIITGIEPGQFADSDTTSAAILIANFPINTIGKIEYLTSELLTLRSFNDEQLLVVHGQQGNQGELSLTDLPSPATIRHVNKSIVIQEQSEDRITITYHYQTMADGFQQFVLDLDDGSTLRIVITATQNAGHIWFEKNNNNEDIIIAGPDWIDRAGESFIVESNDNNRNMYILSPRSLSAPAGFIESTPYNPATQSAVFFNGDSLLQPTINASLLSIGKSQRDHHESHVDYKVDDDNNPWKSWTGTPTNLEHNDIIKGHAWYRAELQLNRWFGLPWWESSDLFIEHASDIVGIYVNGHYVTTVAPLGTEIDSDSKNSNYRFPNLRRYLKRGKNIIAFRTEIWGHGSFMFPRGKILGTKAQLPAVGFDSVKGLLGTAKVGKRHLEHWSVRANLKGEIEGYDKAHYDDSHWQQQNIPLNLEKGDITWYRTSFDTSALPNQDNFHAPIALTLKGTNTKATIFLNGRLIGRWISDNNWLSRGFWGRAQRDMWMNTDPDDFPINHGLLKGGGEGEENILAIAFEDTSGHTEDAGVVEILEINYAREKSRESAIKIKRNILLRAND